MQARPRELFCHKRLTYGFTLDPVLRKARRVLLEAKQVLIEAMAGHV